MKCKWYAEFEGVCTNGECPYRGDVCPTSEHPEVCRCAEAAQETELNVEELVTALRFCAGEECKNCLYIHLSGSGTCCDDYLKQKAADMLEKLAAEKDAKKTEKKHEAYLCSLDSCLLSGGQYIDDIRVFYDDGKCGERPGHSLDAASGAAEGGKAMKTPDEIKLKPCPFCGGKVSLVLCDDEGNLHDEAYREHPYSGLGFMLHHAHEENPECPIASYECDGGILGRVYIYDTEEQATEAWNRRAENG